MKAKKNIILLIMAISLLTIGFILSTHAQEMGWDNNEEVQRLEQKQWDEAEQGGTDKYEATGIETPPATTSGEKNLEKWQKIPTGFARKDFIISQDNLAGKWDKANIYPSPQFESGWQSLDSSAYHSALKTGAVDKKLKGTIYEPYLSNMERICKTAPNAEAVHIKSPEASPEWRMKQRFQKPYTLTRELTFECLVKIK